MSESGKPQSAVTMFFKLGDKVTGGDPKRKADFDYYLLWVMFLAFFAIMVTNIMTGISLARVGEIWLSIKAFAWGLLIMAIVWFQYGALKQTWQNRARIKSLPNIKDLKASNEPIGEDSIEEMEAEFK